MQQCVLEQQVNKQLSVEVHTDVSGSLISRSDYTLLHTTMYFDYIHKVKLDLDVCNPVLFNVATL